MEVSQLKARAIQLGYKQATSGLTPEETQELASINQQLQLAALKDKASQGG